MDKKEYLQRYHDYKVKIERKQQLIDMYAQFAQNLPSRCSDGTGSNTTRNTKAYYEQYICMKVQEEAKMAVLKKEAEVVKQEITQAINTVGNDILKKILYSRYIEWLSWKEIIDLFNYSASNIYRLHLIALDELVID